MNDLITGGAFAPVREAMRAKEAIDKATVKRRWMLTANALLHHYNFHSYLRMFDVD